MLYIRCILILNAVALLASCSGGGGNSATMPMPTPIAPVPFTSFSAVKSGQPVQASGISQTVDATTSGSLPPTVLSTTVNAVDTTSSNATITYGAIPTITAFSFSTPSSSVSFSSGILCSLGVCGHSTNSSSGAILNALDPALAWNYQTFGYWLAVGSANTAAAGAISVGNPTPISGMPISSTATYTGISAGTYVSSSGTVFVHAANMSSTVDFANRTIAFSTSSTAIGSLTGGGLVLTPSLNLTASLMYAPGSNQFSGTVSAPGTPSLTTSSISGQFYGPTAQEIGGVYSLKAASGPETMLGAFGGKRP